MCYFLRPSRPWKLTGIIAFEIMEVNIYCTLDTVVTVPCCIRQKETYFSGFFCPLFLPAPLLTLSLPDRISNTPYCLPYNSRDVGSENLALDQPIIPR